MIDESGTVEHPKVVRRPPCAASCRNANDSSDPFSIQYTRFLRDIASDPKGTGETGGNRR